MSKKILFIVPYPFDKAPSQRLKFEQYYSAMEQAGYQVETSSFISERFWKIIYSKGNFIPKVFYTLAGYLRRIGDLFRIRKYDVIYVHLWITPFGFPVFEWIFSLLARKMVYDIDDLIYLGTDVGANKLIHALKGRTKPPFLIRKSDHVIVCTPKLEEYALQFNSAVTDISSTINTDSYQPVNAYEGTTNLTLGWSGSLSTSKYLHLLDTVLGKLSQLENIKLLVIGDKDFKMEGVNLEAIEWKSETEVENLQRIDIGLYPLPDEEWVYGKSGLKALQYMALGIPTVATGIGANFRIIENGQTGFLVNSEEEWINAIQQLIQNPALRESVGKSARNFVEENYSIRANTPTYLGILEDVLSDNG